MLIELLISILIMGAMSTVVLTANANMSARLQTDNLAHLIALSIREAQTKALSAVAPTGVTDANDIPGYGVYISLGANTHVQLFSDTRADTVNGIPYSSSFSQPVGFPLILGQGYTIDGFSAVPYGGGTPPDDVGAVSIYFHRPRPDADIFYSESLTVYTPSTRASQASIVIRSPKSGITKTITVTSTGQISVQ